MSDLPPVDSSGPGVREVEEPGREPEVLAAGGIVVREGEGGGCEIAVVHRPARSDWGFPKGKLDPGETLEACALREVHEETGLRCALGPLAGRTRYRDRQMRDKAVTYWIMRAAGGEFQPNREVDELRWISPADAAGVLTYACDRALLQQVAPQLSAPPTRALPD